MAQIVYLSPFHQISFIDRESYSDVSIQYDSARDGPALTNYPARYLYAGFGTITESSGSYSVTYTGAYTQDGGWSSGGARSLEFTCSDVLEVRGTYTPSIYSPQPGHTAFSIDVVGAYEQLPSRTDYALFLGFSNTSPQTYPNDISLFSKSDVYFYIFRIVVDNPSYITYTYPVHLYTDPSTEYVTLNCQYQTRNTIPPSTYPYILNQPDYQNADTINPSVIVKPGYKSLGWDTSSSATTVVYGGRDTVTALNIPANTIPVSTSGGLNLYSVWKKNDALYVYVNGEKKSVDIASVVTGINGSTAVTRQLVEGKVFDGTNWRSFQL